MRNYYNIADNISINSSPNLQKLRKPTSIKLTENSTTITRTNTGYSKNVQFEKGKHENIFMK